MQNPSQSAPEPWLRGPIAGVDPLTAPILYAFEQAREDLAHHTEGLTTDQLWAKPFGFGSVGFHIRHIGRSVDRLMSYLDMRPLSADQIAGLNTEHEPGASIEELFAELDEILLATQLYVRLIDPSILRDVRTVGRKRLPTTVIGLLTHIAEHTQRHVGQAISAAKLARQTVVNIPRSE
jgi:DinB superfamily